LLWAGDDRTVAIKYEGRGGLEGRKERRNKSTNK
jgi:hypothetical protein